MFKYAQRDKEDLRLSPNDVEAYAKLAKASYHASAFVQAWCRCKRC